MKPKKIKLSKLWLIVGIVGLLIVGTIIGSQAFPKETPEIVVNWDFQTKVTNAPSCVMELIPVLESAEASTLVSNINLGISTLQGNNLYKTWCVQTENKIGKKRCECQIGRKR